MAERGRKRRRRTDIGRAFLGSDRTQREGENERFAEIRHRAIVRVGQQAHFPGVIIQGAITESV
ncbi:MAG TPA: hypothetical protein VFK41_06480 [Nocardioidaceae bacterium]|nr:hypothetical protein [Nocardioidaceae bacterium]